MTLQTLYKNKFITGSFALAFILTGSGMFWAYFVLRHIPQPLILHYNGLTGINQIGNILDLIGWGVTGLIMLAMDFWIAADLEERSAWWGKIVTVASLVLGALIFIGFWAIISVN